MLVSTGDVLFIIRLLVQDNLNNLHGVVSDLFDLPPNALHTPLSALLLLSGEYTSDLQLILLVVVLQPLQKMLAFLRKLSESLLLLNINEYPRELSGATLAPCILIHQSLSILHQHLALPLYFSFKVFYFRPKFPNQFELLQQIQGLSPLFAAIRQDCFEHSLKQEGRILEGE